MAKYAKLIITPLRERMSLMEESVNRCDTSVVHVKEPLSTWKKLEEWTFFFLNNFK